MRARTAIVAVIVAAVGALAAVGVAGCGETRGSGTGSGPETSPTATTP